MIPLLPVTILALMGGTGYVVYKRKGKMTPDRKKLFETAFETLKPPAKLRELANMFEKEGHKTEAELLRKRAALREQSPEKTAKERAIFKQAMSSNNPDAVMKIAKIFRDKGALGAAKKLENYANGLRKANLKNAAPQKDKKKDEKKAA